MCIRIDSRPDHLPRLRTIVGCLAADLGMTSQETHDTNLALTEACANAIRHGSPHGAESGVLIRIVSDHHAMIVEVTDEGGGFDVNQLSHHEPLEKPGGLGIPLMRALADEVQFLKAQKGMTVRLVKKINGRVGRRRIWVRKQTH